MNAPVLAVDIGGTKIATGLVHEGALLRSYRCATPDGDARQVWEAVRTAVEATRDGEPIGGIGVGCAGPVDAEGGTVSPINVPGWHRFPLVQHLAELVPGVPVALAGDGVCMAVGEHLAGAGRQRRHLLGMVVSTGVGGGLVFDGRPFPGHTGNAGHIGHVVVEPDGVWCSCGGRGCLETVAAGPAMVRWARVNGWQAPVHAHAEHLAAAALIGDKVARTAFDRAGRAIGRVLAGVAAVCDVEMVVIGGGVARSGPLLFEPIRQAVAAHARLSFTAGLLVVPAALDGDAALIGAAALVSSSESSTLMP